MGGLSGGCSSSGGHWDGLAMLVVHYNVGRGHGLLLEVTWGWESLAIKAVLALVFWHVRVENDTVVDGGESSQLHRGGVGYHIDIGAGLITKHWNDRSVDHGSPVSSSTIIRRKWRKLAHSAAGWNVDGGGLQVTTVSTNLRRSW